MDVQTNSGTGPPYNDALPVLWYPGHEVLLRNIVRAENCHLFDGEGRKYVDLESGVWCTSVGHGNPRILRILTEQAARIAHTGFNYSNEIVEETARELLDVLAFAGGKCVFLCSGSEAVEYGVRVAQSLADRPLFLTMTDSYFGAYGSASAKRESEWVCFDWSPCAACPYEEDECSKRCEHWAAIPFPDVGGFLFEPGSSSGLVRFPPEKLIRTLAATIKRDGGLVLMNEVTTGIGRTGEWFGFQHYRLSPDIVAMGKGIGNGYPVSATAFAPGVIRRLGGKPVKYAQSHQNDPLGASIAREVIRIIRDDRLIERSRSIGAALVHGLKAVQARTDKIRDVRARGLMAAVELNDDPRNSLTISAHRELARRGYILGRRPGINVLRLDPGLTIDRADIEGFLEAFEDVLAAG